MAHQADRLRAQHTRAVERASVEEHLQKLRVVSCSRRESSTADRARHRDGWLNGVRRKLSVGLPPMHGHETATPAGGNVVGRIHHGQRAENALLKILLEPLAGAPLDQAAHPIGARAVHPLLAGLEEQGASRVLLTFTRLEVPNDRAREVVAESRRVRQQVSHRRLPAGRTNGVTARPRV